MSNRRARYVPGSDERERGYSTGAYPPESEATSTLSEEGAPDCIGKLLGVRLFKPRPPWASPTPRKDRLYSLCFDHAWTPGENVRAECRSLGERKAAEHLSPYEECMCGVYAFYSYWLAWCEDVGYGFPKIFAVVSAWGEIEEHSFGFRSEYMRIEALVGPSPSTIRRKKAHQVIERFAGIYEVPIIKSPWHVHGWMDGFAGGVHLKHQK